MKRKNVFSFSLFDDKSNETFEVWNEQTSKETGIGSKDSNIFNELLSTDNDEDLPNLVEPTYIDISNRKEKPKKRISEVNGRIVHDYVDNDILCNEITRFNYECKLAKQDGKVPPSMPEYIGTSLVQIADGLGSRFNFKSYTYLDEMKEDGILACIKAVPKFDTSRSTKAFGFFTFIMWQAFCTRIKIEKKQQTIKEDMIKDPIWLSYTVGEYADEYNRPSKENVAILYD